MKFLCTTALVPVTVSKMETLLIDYDIIDALFKSVQLHINLADFENLNQIIHCETIVGLLFKLHWSLSYFNGWGGLYHEQLVQRIRELGRSKDEMCANIAINIVKLLAHPNFDHSVYQNVTVLAGTIISTFIGNDQLDQILTYHNLNPDTILGGDSIGALLRDKTTDPERILIFLKHGAAMHFNIGHGDQLVYMATYNSEILDVIVTHTKQFAGFSIYFGPDSNRKVFDSVLRCGNLFALEQIGNHTTNIQKYEKWLRTIRKHAAMDIDAMRSCFDMPIQSICLVDSDIHIDRSVRKLILFKHNLECLTQSTITVPAYKYYDVVIIILFLIKNPHLTILTCDVLRYIATLVFS